MDMICIVPYCGFFGGFRPFKNYREIRFLWFIIFRSKDGHVGLKRISQISTHLQIRANFSFTFLSWGRDLFLGVEDCKDPKFSTNLKFDLLLFWPDRKEIREIEGIPEILRINSIERLGGHIYYSKPMKSVSEFPRVSENFRDFINILMIYYTRKNEIF